MSHNSQPLIMKNMDICVTPSETTSRKFEVAGTVPKIVYSILCLLTVFSLMLLGYNELRMMIVSHLNNRIYKEYIAASCEPNSQLTEKIIHIDCPLKNLKTFYPPLDFSWNLNPFEGIFFEVKMEMYQYTIDLNRKGLTIAGTWSENLLPSPSMPLSVYHTYINPDHFPHVKGTGRQYTDAAYAGDYKIHPAFIRRITSKKKLNLIDDGVYIKAESHPPLSINYANTQVYKNTLYTGDPTHPKVGDIRITFWGNSATHVSAIGVQTLNGPPLNRYYSLKPLTGGHMNTTITIFEEGDLMARDLLKEHASHQSGAGWTAIIIRTISLAIMAVTVFYTFKLYSSKGIPVIKLALFSLTLSSAGLSIILAFSWMFLNLWTTLFFTIWGIISGAIACGFWYGERTNANVKQSAVEVTSIIT